MTTSLPLADRLRIELAVWLLGYRLQDLPSRRRRAVLRELRANLTAASSEHGASEALRRLGSRRELAEAYLEAEYGEEGPRPSLAKALFWVLVVQGALLGWTFVGHAAFVDGVVAADPADGTYSWSPAGQLGPSGTVTVASGDGQSLSVGLPAIFVLYLALAAALGGRAWRLLRRRRRQATTAASAVR